MKIEAFKISEILLKICLFQSVYTLYVTGYSYTGENVGDEFAEYHSGLPFSTFDNDNDNGRIALIQKKNQLKKNSCMITEKLQLSSKDFPASLCTGIFFS